MKPKLHTVIAAAFFLAAFPAAAFFLAAFPAAAEKGHTQQDKFAQCAHDSKGLKGEERNKFMSECLKAHDAPAGKAKADKPVKEARNEADARETPQNRMKSCNDDARAKELHGDERRAFMSACLKSRD